MRKASKQELTKCCIVSWKIRGGLMERKFLLHLKSGNKIITEKEAIENALQQEEEGVKPHYCYYDYKNNMRFRILCANGI